MARSSPSACVVKRVAPLLAVLLLTWGGKTSALPQPFLMPFPAGETWYICQGYQGVSHGSGYSLDLSTYVASSGTQGCNPAYASAASGRTVTSPGSGVVRYVGPDYVCIDFDQGGSTEIGHMTRAVSAGARVSAGQKIGTVNAPNSTNGNYAHIHIEVHAQHGCASDVPFDDAYGARFDCGPNLPAGQDHTGKALKRCVAGDNSAGGDKLKLNTDSYADIFRYDPVNGRVIVTNMTNLTGVSNKYDSGNGAWAASWQNHFADLDGDGDKDVFRYSGYGRVVVTRFNSALSGLSSPNAYDGSGWGDSHRKFAFGRIEGQSYENVVSYDPTSGDLDYYRFTNTTASTWSLSSVSWSVGTGWNIHTADMNGDGDDEVVRYHPSTGRLIIENGWARTEVFDSADIGTSFGTGRIMSFGNLNGTGAEELISYNPSSGDFVIYTFNTSTMPWVWDDRHRASLEGGWTMMTGDLDGGADELFRYQPSTGRVIVEQFSADLNSRYERYDSSGISSWGTNREHSLADLNGDGIDEVFRYEPGVGHVTITKFTNTTSATWGFTNTYHDQPGWGAYWEISVH